MIKSIKSLASLGLMGVPVWIVLTCALRLAPTSVAVFVDEPGVQVWVGDRAQYATSSRVGPVEVEPGEYRVRVLREGLPVFDRLVAVAAGEQVEIRARSSAATGWEGRPTLADLETPVLVASERPLEGIGDAVTAVGFAGAGDESQPVAAGVGGTLRSWDPRSGRANGLVAAHAGSVVGMVILADGRRAVTAGADNVLRLWELVPLRELRMVATGLASPVHCLAASPDGRLAAVGVDAGLVHVFDLETGRERYSRSLDAFAAASLAFSPDGNTLLVGRVGDSQADTPVDVWDASTGTVVGSLRGHFGPVWGLAFLPDSRRAVTVGRDTTLRLWDVAEGRELKRFDNHPGAVFGVAVSADGRYALTGSGHRWAGGWREAEAYGVTLWDLVKGRALGRLDTSAPISSVAFSHDSHFALAGGEGQYLRKWELPALPSSPTVPDKAIADSKAVGTVRSNVPS